MAKKRTPDDYREQLKVAIRQLVRAEVADSWSGAGDKDDIPIIEAELRAAKIRVSTLITQLPIKGELV